MNVYSWVDRSQKYRNEHSDACFAQMKYQMCMTSGYYQLPENILQSFSLIYVEHVYKVIRSTTKVRGRYFVSSGQSFY
jgi:hypothetical protein